MTLCHSNGKNYHIKNTDLTEALKSLGYFQLGIYISIKEIGPSSYKGLFDEKDSKGKHFYYKYSLDEMVNEEWLELEGGNND